jgi:tetratricopeptide (TPR) repeat protein
VSGKRRPFHHVLAILLWTAALSACGATNQDQPGGGLASSGRLETIVLPDLSSAEPATRQRIEAQHQTATSMTGAASDADRAAAFGELGVLLMGSEFYDSARPAFEIASRLAPGDPRWLYYLAHAHRRTQNLPQAAVTFERVVRLKPDDLTSAWWLGYTYLELGRHAEAEAQFKKTETADGFAAASLYGLGRAALAREQYAEAARYLERVLALDSSADAARYPLGLAYRGLGRVAEASAQLRRRTAEDIRPPDPLIDALAGVVETADAHYGLGIEASRAADWPDAIAEFRRALALDPRHAPAALNLAVALHRSGDGDAARAEARQAVALAPPEARPRAHYVVGTLEALAGRDADAIAAYEEALRVDGRFIEAHLSLAQALRRQGRVQEALARYRTILAIEPAESEAIFGSAVMLVRLRRYREAGEQFSAGMRAHPGERRFAHALARILAASPDPAARDGRRAVTIMEELMALEPTVDRAQTLAMALAEAGRFDDAIAMQRRVVEAVGNDARTLAVANAALRGYQRREPARVPWPPDDPIFAPPPQDAPILE